jgi:hypothetical protein
VRDPFLGLRLGCGSRLCRKLEHCRFLICQAHDLPIWKFQRIVMRQLLMLVDLPEDTSKRDKTRTAANRFYCRYRLHSALCGATDSVLVQPSNRILENTHMQPREKAYAVRLPDGDLPAVAGDGTSKSAASRRFVALSATQRQYRARSAYIDLVSALRAKTANLSSSDPGRQLDLLPVVAAHARPMHRDLAAVEADLALGRAPAMSEAFE